jgi:hypothetical protein
MVRNSDLRFFTLTQLSLTMAHFANTFAAQLFSMIVDNLILPDYVNTPLPGVC